MRIRFLGVLIPALLPALSFGGDAVFGGEGARSGAVRDALLKIVAAYPDQRLTVDGDAIVWPDGTRMQGDDGKGVKPFGLWLADPDLEDMLAVPYPAGAGISEPAPDRDPGRARNETFFTKMYGDCRKGGVSARLKRITWLKKKAPQTIEVTAVNGVAEKLEAVSRELDDLPQSFDKYLAPAAGTYNCRVIAGTSRPSAHGAGIAIDIATRHSSYWRWAGSGSKSGIAFRNEIPIEIVRIFEKHGFIWGGRWYHYDTMHFEYRPELLP